MFRFLDWVTDEAKGWQFAIFLLFLVGLMLISCWAISLSFKGDTRQVVSLIVAGFWGWRIIGPICSERWMKW